MLIIYVLRLLMVSATDYFYDVLLFLKAATQFAVVLIQISGSVNWGWWGFNCSEMTIVSALVCLMRFVLVLMDNEDLSPLSFLSPALSFFLPLGCSGYHHHAAITKQYSGQIRLGWLFTAFVS